MTIEEFCAKYNIILPFGGMEYSANMEYIFDCILVRYTGEIVLSRKEFINFFKVFKDELLVSMLLDGKKSMNSYFKNGIEFRGIKVLILQAKNDKITL